MKSTRPLIVAAMLAIALAGCSREPDAEPATNDTETVDAAPIEEPSSEPTPLADPVPAEPASDVNASAEMSPEPVTPPDEQMLDDASASGMTSRAERDQQSADAEPTAPDMEQK